MSLRVIAYGGGVQSTALCVLATEGRLDEIMGGPVDAALFCNVGDDSEDPATLAFVNYALPWFANRGLTVETLQRHRRDGSVETLRGRLTRPDTRSLAVPLYGTQGKMVVPRSCTADFKVAVIAKWLKQRGATADNPATVAIGISTDEWHRVGAGREEAWERRLYPLIDLDLDRAACMRLIADAGLPVPPKSSCYFCPFHKLSVFQEMRRDRPALFDQAAEVERIVSDKQVAVGRNPVFLTRYGRPLADAVGEAQDRLDGFEGACDEGYCFV
jgi:hypothetical protein